MDLPKWFTDKTVNRNISTEIIVQEYLTVVKHCNWIVKDLVPNRKCN